MPILGMVLSATVGNQSLGAIGFLATVRVKHPSMPVLVIFASEDRDAANRASLLGARLAWTPITREALMAFGCACVMGGGQVRERLTEALAVLMQRHRLSPSLAANVALVLRGRTPEDICEERNVSMSTYRSQVRELLDRTGADDMRALTARLLRWIDEHDL